MIRTPQYLMIIFISLCLACIEIEANANDQKELTNSRSKVPVIGILSQVLRDYKRFSNEKQFHLVSSYVKWIEATGAQVIPILLNKNDSYYESIFNQTNGLLFPGGDNMIDPTKKTPMLEAARKLYKLAVGSNDRGDYYPIWGTCLGLELLSVLSSNKNVLSRCSGDDIVLPVEFRIKDGKSKMFAPRDFLGLKTGLDYSKIIEQTLERSNLTYHFHHYCLTDQDLIRSNLGSFYKPLGYSRDINGLEFITIFEAIKYPFYGVQFHPEKAQFEMVIKKDQFNIPHSLEAIAVSKFFAQFFVEEAKLNKNPIAEMELGNQLIYSHNPMYTAIKRDMYEQRYLFPYEHKDGISDEEFYNEPE